MKNQLKTHQEHLLNWENNITVDIGKGWFNRKHCIQLNEGTNHRINLVDVVLNLCRSYSLLRIQLNKMESNINSIKVELKLTKDYNSIINNRY